MGLEVIFLQHCFHIKDDKFNLEELELLKSVFFVWGLCVSWWDRLVLKQMQIQSWGVEDVFWGFDISAGLSVVRMWGALWDFFVVLLLLYYH